MAAVPSIGRAERVEREGVAGAEATRSLYERFAGQIFGYCLHQLGSREEAEDAVQTTFMNAFRGLKRGIVPELESAWLFKIAHNVCLSRRRSSWRRGRVESPNNMEVLQEVVPARERNDDELIRLQDALEGMPESQRRAILLREWQGLSYREIGDVLGLTQAAVETLIFRARRTLAAGLEEPPAAEERNWRTRARHSIDAGSLLAAFKTVFATGAAKVAVTTAAVATTAVVAATAAHDHPSLRPSRPARDAAPATHAAAATAPASAFTLAPTRHVVRAPIVPAATTVAPRHAPTHRVPVRDDAAPPAAMHSAPSEATSVVMRPTVVSAPPAVAQSAPPASVKHARPQKMHKDKPVRIVEATHESTPTPPPVPAAPQAEQHGQPTAPGQQDKAEKADKGNGHK